MKYSISETNKGIEIQVENIGERKAELLESFQACQEGRCSCPTEEYKKLESLDIVQNGDAIHLQLKALAGETFNVNEINRCLEHTTQQAAEGKKTNP